MNSDNQKKPKQYILSEKEYVRAKRDKKRILKLKGLHKQAGKILSQVKE